MTSLRVSQLRPSGLTVPRLGFDEFLVTAVVVALFFERVDDWLWLSYGFPIPDPTFVLVGAVVIGRAAFLAIRGRFDLSKPNWRESIVIGLFAVYAVTSVAAALLGHSHPQPHGKPLVLVSHLGQSIKTFAHFAYLALIALILGRLLTPALLRRAVLTFFILIVAAAAVACLQALDQNALHTGATGALHLASRETNSFIRPSSIFSEPAVLGYYMLIGVIGGIWLNAASPSRWIWLGIGLCVVATLLGAAAGPAVAFFVGFAFLLWRAWRVLLRSWRELAMVAVAAIAVLVFLPVGQTLSNRASGTATGGDHSAQYRLAQDHASVKIWHLAPLTGVGLGDDRYYNPSLVHLSFLPNANLAYQNVNTYLGALSESGVFGLLLLSIMLLALVLPLGRVRREGAWVTEAPILLCIVAFFFLNFYAYPIFWFFVGARLAQLRQLEGLGDSTQQQAERPEPMTA